MRHITQAQPPTEASGEPYFVGPVAKDVNAAIVGQLGAITMGKPTVDLSNGNTRHIGTGEGYLDFTKKCRILLFELGHVDGWEPFVGDGKLTEEEVARVKDNSYRVVRLSVLCGSGG